MFLSKLIVLNDNMFTYDHLIRSIMKCIQVKMKSRKLLDYMSKYGHLIPI